MLDVTGEVVEVKAAVFAVVGLYLDSHTASVIACDCRERAVVDVEAAVVAAGDDPVADSPFATFGEKHLAGQLTASLEPGSSGVVELLAGHVVAGDHHDVRRGLLVAGVEPCVDDGGDGVALGRVDGDVVGLVLDVGVGVAVVQRGKRLALGGVALTE
ncbi:MAG TPA: hypothetical protein VKO16_00450, partial [Polyangia bacterium]|nr:hypothetical protein [Polyangia bacterium]